LILLFYNFWSLLEALHNILWGDFLVFTLFFVSIYLTFIFKFITFKKFPLSFKLSVKDESSAKGISSFAALCSSLGATIGTGNIVGVASAISIGGEGAVFWMAVASIFGMATKYAECLLAVKFREYSEDNTPFGGPFLYIEKGLGKRFKPLSIMFAFFGAAAGILGIGTVTQINSITLSIEDLFDPRKITGITLGGRHYTLPLLISGILFTLLSMGIILGGIKRISKILSFLVPFMTGIFLFCSLLLIFNNISFLPSALKRIWESAFSFSSLSGGLVGVGFKEAVGRGIFSNEAGLGSAAIAAAATREKEPVKIGLIMMLSNFIDTTLLCTITALGIIITDSHTISQKAVGITTLSWQRGLPFGEEVSSFLITLCLVFFAFTSIIGWSAYAQGCFSYLTKYKKSALKIYHLLYALALLSGLFFDATSVWLIADVCNALMALPNLTALVLLSPTVKAETRSFFKRNS